MVYVLLNILFKRWILKHFADKKLYPASKELKLLSVSILLSLMNVLW